MDRFLWSGTYPEHVLASAAPALALHERLGAVRKLERMRHLAQGPRARVGRLRGMRFYASEAADARCGITTVELPGVDAGALQCHLWERHRIFVQDMSGNARTPEIRGIRVTPNVYTAPSDLDRLAVALERVAKRGLG